MNTTLLSPPERVMLSSIARAAGVLLVLLYLDTHYPGRSNTPEEITAILGWDERTIHKHLSSLSAANLAMRQGRGYVLTLNGRHTLFGTQDQAQVKALAQSPNAPAELTISPDLGTQAQAQFKALAQSPNELVSTKCAENEKRCTKCVPEDEKSTQNVHSLRTVVVDDESLILIKTTTTNNAQNVQKLLEMSRMLFGDENAIAPQGIPERSQVVVLGLLAQAYRNRHKLSNPAGMVAAKLRRGEKPPVYFMDYWMDLLPRSFLVAVNLAEPESEPEPEIEDEILELSPRVAKDETVTGKVERAWQSALSQLQMEMPKASFDTWVRDIVPVRWEDGILQLGVRNAYARDWLESRLTSTVTRLMCGILNANVQVEFVVVSTETEE